MPLSDCHLHKGNGGHTRRCKECDPAYQRLTYKLNPEYDKASVTRYVERLKAEAEQQYEEWMELTNIDFKPLTEKDWLEACSYFGGCAICGNEHIETRHFLLPFKEGGRYAAWNVFPLCLKCSVVTKNYKNPFLWLCRPISRQASKMDLTNEHKQRLIEYFILQIERCKTDEQKTDSV